MTVSSHMIAKIIGPLPPIAIEIIEEDFAASQSRAGYSSIIKNYEYLLFMFNTPEARAQHQSNFQSKMIPLPTQVLIWNFSNHLVQLKFNNHKATWFTLSSSGADGTHFFRASFQSLRRRPFDVKIDNIWNIIHNTLNAHGKFPVFVKSILSCSRLIRVKERAASYSRRSKL